MRAAKAVIGLCCACNAPGNHSAASDPGKSSNTRRGSVVAASSGVPTRHHGLNEGQRPPALELTLQDGSRLDLESLQGKKVVLFFYPMDDTPGCRAEARGFRDHHQDFLDSNSVVMGVSLQGAESHREFIEKEKLPFDLVVDNDAAVSRAFGVPIHGQATARQTYLLNEDGSVEAVWRQVSPKEHAKEVLDAIRN